MLPGLSSWPSARVSGSLPAALLAIVSTFIFTASPVRAADLASVLAGQKNLTVFSGLLTEYPDLFANLSSVTVLAPNDAAFDKLGNWGAVSSNPDSVKSIINYHIINKLVTSSSIFKGASTFASTKLTDPAYTNVTGGQTLILTKDPSESIAVTSGFATRGTLIVEDLKFDGGLVHVIDSVMRVPGSIEETAREAYTDLTAFLGALYAVGIVSDFTQLGNVTIFIPHSSAFQELAGTFSSMGQDQLKRVLNYHLIPKTVLHSWQFLDSSALTTNSGGIKVNIELDANSIYINSARIIQADILIDNGLVQMIDNVLNPDVPNAKPNLTAATQTPVFDVSGAAQTGTGAATPFSNDIPCTVSCLVKPTGTLGGGVQSSLSRAGVPAPRCTGVLAGAGMGLGMAIGAMIAL
ncbi:FAS1 domain-containing protein [Lasiosphaeria miniovina]|uniref:FAS1 domain-containing protein n=1 Tax=Lasiosphaeria miniovina TaxID=1954250 RepID=A0AA40ACE9_9PEZI|nr:FAS1 domain-containing protein [Lasiosphaeria miniovina]KAK0713170.1 FAS1 domain-containing protein [Lasiosphaeria miniovina]